MGLTLDRINEAAQRKTKFMKKLLPFILLILVFSVSAQKKKVSAKKLNSPPSATVKLFYQYLCNADLNSAQKLMSATVALSPQLLRLGLSAGANECKDGGGLKAVVISKQNIENEKAGVIGITKYKNGKSENFAMRLYLEKGSWRIGFNPEVAAKSLENKQEYQYIRPQIQIPKTTTILAIPCPLALASAPTLRGFSLGLGKQQFIEQIPTGFSDLVFSDGSQIILSNILDKAGEGFKDVKEISAEFFQEKISVLKIKYSDEVDWNNSYEFASNLSDNLGLAFKYWEIPKHPGSYAQMNCSEFSMEIESSYNEIKLTDKLAITKQKELEKQNIENKKKVFKP